MADIKDLLQNSRVRVFGILIFIVFVIFIAFVYFSSNKSSDAGSARLASVPKNVGYQPGSKNLSDAYLKTLLQSDSNQAQRALQQGQSSLPTYIQRSDADLSGQKIVSSDFQKYCRQCCVRCYSTGGQAPSETTEDLLNKWMKSGNISPVAAAELNRLAEEGASVDDYAAKLNQLVKEGKLTPEQARRLLAAYKKAHPEADKTATGSLLDDMLADGSISPETAKTLKDLANSGLSPDDYAARLQQLVKEGKLTPEQARKLLAAYRKDHAQAGGTEATDSLLNKMLADGSISPETAKTLKDLANSGLSPDDYAARLQQLVREGKLTPEQARKLLATYRKDHAQAGGQPTANDLASQMANDGSIPPEAAAQLQDLANSGASVGDYAAKLNQLVREGKLTPEQARRLLEAYRREHAKVKPKPTTGSLLDDLVGAGKLSPEVASKLKDLANQGLSPSDYAARLNQLVREGKLTPEQAKKLLEAYRRGQKRIGNAASAHDLAEQMLASGSISPDTAKALKNLADKGLSVGDYAARLKQLVKEGKLTPEQARKLLAAYRQKNMDKGITSTSPSTGNLLHQMLGDGSISPDTAKELQSLSESSLSPDDYAARLQQLVKEGKLTPEQAKRLLAAYKREHPEMEQGASHQDLTKSLLAAGQISPDVASTLNSLDADGVPASQYAAELARLVREGKLTPEQAQKLLESYRAKHGDATITGKGQLAKLQEQQQKQELQRQMQVLREAAERRKRLAESAKTANAQQAVQSALSAISGQANQLITSWNVSPQGFVRSSFSDKQEKGEGAGSGVGFANGKKQDVPPALIKAGSIVFAVLETAVNSDQPGPIMATVVSGKFKGGKLIGGLTQTSDGQRVMLTFNSFSMPVWPSTISINAVAINPDTARTAIASSVDNHYLLRYGSVFASSFILGYSKAVMASGSTTTNDSGGTTTKTDIMGPREKIMVGLGEVGNKLGSAATSYFAKKPTVRVDAGVGLGILFLADLSKPVGVD